MADQRVVAARWMGRGPGEDGADLSGGQLVVLAQHQGHDPGGEGRRGGGAVDGGVTAGVLRADDADARCRHRVVGPHGGELGPAAALLDGGHGDDPRVSGGIGGVVEDIPLVARGGDDGNPLVGGVGQGPDLLLVEAGADAVAAKGHGDDVGTVVDGVLDALGDGARARLPVPGVVLLLVVDHPHGQDAGLGGDLEHVGGHRRAVSSPAGVSGAQTVLVVVGARGHPARHRGVVLLHTAVEDGDCDAFALGRPLCRGESEGLRLPAHGGGVCGGGGQRAQERAESGGREGCADAPSDHDVSSSSRAPRCRFKSLARVWAASRQGMRSDLASRSVRPHSPGRWPALRPSTEPTEAAMA